MGLELNNLTDEELCDLMCGSPEEDYDRDCENCKHYKKAHDGSYYSCERWTCDYEEK